MATDYKPHTVWVKRPYGDIAELKDLPAQDRVLHFIVNYGPCCVSHIVNRLGFNKSTVARTIAELSEKKLIRSEIRPGVYQGRNLNFYLGMTS